MVNYNLFLINSPMKKQHHFCFLFTRIELLKIIQPTQDYLANFKIYLLHNGSVIGETKEILDILAPNNEVIFLKEEIRCTFSDEYVQRTSNLEIKLTEIIQQSDQRLIGSYKFGIKNYIHISDQLNRHCVELSIQIGENYTIYYEVFIDRIKQGVDQIIQEHELSKSLIKQEETDDFLLEEIQYFPVRSKTKEFKLDSEEFIVINQRFWSPTWAERNNTPKRQSKRRYLTKKNSINETSFSKIEMENSQSLIPELKPAESTIDDLDKLEREERIALSEVDDQELSIFDPQLQSSNNSESQQKTMQEMYQVIRSNSQIMLPKPSDPFRIGDKQALQQETNKQNRFARKITHAKYFKKYMIAFVLVLLIVMLLLNCFKQPTYSSKKYQRKNGKQYTL